MKELNDFVNELKKLFSLKELELKANPDFNSQTSGKLLNRQREIEIFEAASKNYDKHPLLKKTIINNFKKDFDIIKSAISDVSC